MIQSVAADMYAAQARVNELRASGAVGTDEFLDARLALASARAAYEAIMDARSAAWVQTIRQG